MKSETPKISRLESISHLHRLLALPGPTHPLISLLDATEGQIDLRCLPESYILSFYKVSFITELGGQFKYGQAHYDFEEGSLLFTAPNQVIGGREERNEENRGYSLVFHPDFLQGYPLAKKIKHYGFFSYAVTEALHVSEQEKATILAIFAIIQQELASRIDDFSNEVINSQLDLLLNYSKRFYKRQFLTRQVATTNLLQQVEELLTAYYEDEKLLKLGIPTVQYLAEQLHYTPNYLSDMLRSLTGLNAQQHIHQMLIERAKDLLSTTRLTISEVAYKLGFEHSQSFSRLFKLKTHVSPVHYRATFD